MSVNSNNKVWLNPLGTGSRRLLGGLLGIGLLVGAVVVAHHILKGAANGGGEQYSSVTEKELLALQRKAVSELPIEVNDGDEAPLRAGMTMDDAIRERNAYRQNYWREKLAWQRKWVDPNVTQRKTAQEIGLALKWECHVVGFYNYLLICAPDAKSELRYAMNTYANGVCSMDGRPYSTYPYWKGDKIKPKIGDVIAFDAVPYFVLLSSWKDAGLRKVLRLDVSPLKEQEVGAFAGCKDGKSSFVSPLEDAKLKNTNKEEPQTPVGIVPGWEDLRVGEALPSGVKKDCKELLLDPEDGVYLGSHGLAEENPWESGACKICRHGVSSLPCAIIQKTTEGLIGNFSLELPDDSRAGALFDILKQKWGSPSSSTPVNPRSYRWERNDVAAVLFFNGKYANGLSIFSPYITVQDLNIIRQY